MVKIQFCWNKKLDEKVFESGANKKCNYNQEFIILEKNAKK
jgi:hypothetical protein